MILFPEKSAKTGFFILQKNTVEYNNQFKTIPLRYDPGVFSEFKSADLENPDGDFLDVLENGLFSQSERGILRNSIENGYTNTEIAALLSDTYSGKVETMTLTDVERRWLLKGKSKFP